MLETAEGRQDVDLPSPKLLALLEGSPDGSPPPPPTPRLAQLRQVRAIRNALPRRRRQKDLSFHYPVV